MKTYKQLVSEVARAQSPADKEFVALHPVSKKQFVKYPEGQFKGTTHKDTSKEAHMSNATGMEDELEKEKPLGEEALNEALRKTHTLQHFIDAHPGSPKDKAKFAEHVVKHAGRKDSYDHDDLNKVTKAMEPKHAVKFLNNLVKVKDRPLKEDAELIAELSKQTLKSYTKKATTSSDRAWAKADREEDKAMSTDGNKYPDKQARHQAAANAAIKTWQKREKGIEKAKARLTKEEVEQIDELSKGTLASYAHKASSDLKHSTRLAANTLRDAQDHDKKGDRKSGDKSMDNSHHYNNVAHKRETGLHRAIGKLAK